MKTAIDPVVIQKMPQMPAGQRYLLVIGGKLKGYFPTKKNAKAHARFCLGRMLHN